MDREQHLKTEARLRDALEQSKALYEGARDEHDRAIQRMHDLGMTHPDGSIRHATKVYRYTFHAYRVALMQYNRFILDGELPDEEKPSTQESDRI